MGDFAGVTIESVGEFLTFLRALHLERKKMKKKKTESRR